MTRIVVSVQAFLVGAVLGLILGATLGASSMVIR
jgi:hypothetical protein